MNQIEHSNIVRLVYTKSVYERALLLLLNPTPLDAAIALVLMDNALEAIFKLAIDQSGKAIYTKRDPDFVTLLTESLKIDKLSEMTKYKSSLMTLRTARNGFQHQGIIPQVDSITTDFRQLTETVLGLICSRIFDGLSLEDISIYLLVRDENVRQLFAKGEEAFTKGDYVNAAAYLIYCFETVKSMARTNVIFGSGLMSLRSTIESKYNKDDAVIRYLITLDEEIEVFKLGLDYADLRLYLDVAPLVGINSILYNIGTKGKEDTVISEFAGNLNKLVQDKGLLREWYMTMRNSTLEFALRTEGAWRFSLKTIELEIANMLARLNKSQRDAPE